MKPERRKVIDVKKDQQQVKKPATVEPEVQKKHTKEKTVKRHGSRKAV